MIDTWLCAGVPSSLLRLLLEKAQQVVVVVLCCCAVLLCCDDLPRGQAMRKDPISGAMDEEVSDPMAHEPAFIHYIS